MKKIFFAISFVFVLFFTINYSKATVIVNSVSDLQNRINNTAAENNLTAKIDLNTIDTSVFKSFISDANDGGYYVFFLPSVVNDTYIRYVMYKVKDRPTISLVDYESGCYGLFVNFTSSTYSFHSYNYNLSTKKLVDVNIQQTNAPNTDGYVSCSFIGAVNGNKVYNYDVKSLIDNFVGNFPLKFDDNKDVYGPEFSFVPTYSENYETCNVKLDIKNPPDYYTLEYAINSSTSTWYTFDNINGITIENNCLVIVRMLDENGDELFANSLNITFLNEEISKTYFNVDFSNPLNNSSRGVCFFTPILYNNSSDIFDIYCSYDSEQELNVSYLGKALYERAEHVDWFKVDNHGDYGLHIYKAKDSDVILRFKLVNKNTGITALERTFNLRMNLLSSTDFVSSETNGEKDVMFDSGASNAGNPLFSENSLNVDWSSENSGKLIQSFFNNITSFFNLILAFVSLMPGWITVPLYTLFSVAIFLFVYKFFRG